MKSKTLALAVLVTGVSFGANAFEVPSSAPKELASAHDGTYWGVGLGTVFGALIGGPPGAAIGATLGGSLGWGVDQQNELDETQLNLAEKDLALLKRDEALNQNQVRLIEVQQVVTALSETNAGQSAQLALFEEKGGNAMLENNTLAKVASHYSHEVYYLNGQHSVPDYAQEKLRQLAEFLVEHPSLNVSLKGYTDQRGSPELNKKLAQARADGVKDFLVAHGVSGQRVHLEAIGEGELKAKPGETSNYALDRRVAIGLVLEENIDGGLDDSEALTDSTTPIETEVLNPVSNEHQSDTAQAELDPLLTSPVDEQASSAMPSILSFAEAR